MRKQTKLVAVLSAAALLAIGASMTSFAATGWAEENGTWVYYDKDGYQVTDAWKKSGNNWFYLNSDGEMATDTLIDDGDNTYYVNADGVMVANSWISVENTDDDGEDAPEYYWYYFQNTGKAYKAGEKTSFKTINGKKYAFDEDGKMLYGWVDENSQRLTEDGDWRTATYYCGTQDDGAQVVGWSKIHVIDDAEEDEDQDYWFYFKTNGKKVAGEDKTINSRKYTFADTGKMESGWVDGQATSSVVSDPTATAAEYRYFNGDDDGSRQKGWFKVVPTGDLNKDDHDDENAKWYYAKNDGSLYVNALKTINSKKYAFNENGEMMSGVQALKLSSTDSSLILDHKKIDDEAKIKQYVDMQDESNLGDMYGAWEVYYFGTGEDGAMKMGNQTLDIDGDSYSFFFVKSGSDKGKGFGSATANTQSLEKDRDGNYYPTNIFEKNAIYQHGKKVKADSDLKYEVVDAWGNKGSDMGTMQTPENAWKDTYLINTSGSIMKSKKNVKDQNEVYYCTDKYGRVIYTGYEKCGSTEAGNTHSAIAPH
ncbi:MULTISPECIES: hypothetical protein [Hungatella]|uniref:hypothetical protein n=1 Tax=Hungatella TaxID=1649459 RepID=UPI001F562476|nr:MULTISPECIES: hypothetical protein [Hungatella]